jgi:hypothetical protein
VLDLLICGSSSSIPLNTIIGKVKSINCSSYSGANHASSFKNIEIIQQIKAWLESIRQDLANENGIEFPFEIEEADVNDRTEGLLQLHTENHELQRNPDHTHCGLHLDIHLIGLVG